MMKKIDLDQPQNKAGDLNPADSDPKEQESETQTSGKKKSAELESKTGQQKSENGIDADEQMMQNQTSGSTSALNQLNLNSLDTDMNKHSKKILIVISIIALAAGAGTGFGAYKLRANRSQVGQELGDIEEVTANKIKKGDVFGIQDESTFKDSAQGYLELGGINGEGSHKLLRPGGESQTVYLTSTVTDLDKLVDMEVKVWGETYKGQKAGWLMDVGKVEVINPDAETPVEAEL